MELEAVMPWERNYNNFGYSIHFFSLFLFDKFGFIMVSLKLNISLFWIQLENSVRFLGENRCGLESSVDRFLNKARNLASDNIAAMTEDFQKKEAEYISKLEETTTMVKVMLLYGMLLSSCYIFHILMNKIRGFKL